MVGFAWRAGRGRSTRCPWRWCALSHLPPCIALLLCLVHVSLSLFFHQDGKTFSGTFKTGVVKGTGHAVPRYAVPYNGTTLVCMRAGPRLRSVAGLTAQVLLKARWWVPLHLVRRWWRRWEWMTPHADHSDGSDEHAGGCGAHRALGTSWHQRRPAVPRPEPGSARPDGQGFCAFARCTAVATQSSLHAALRLLDSRL